MNYRVREVHSAVQPPEVHSSDGSRGILSRDNRPLRPLRADDQRMIGRGRSGRSSFRQRLDQGHVPRDRVGSRRAQLTHDIDAATAVFDDGGSDLRILVKAVGQQAPQFGLEPLDREPGRVDASDQREREGPVALDVVFTADIRVVPDRDAKLSSGRSRSCWC